MFCAVHYFNGKGWPWVPFVFLATRALMAHGQIISYQDPQVLLLRAVFQQVSPQSVQGVFLPQVRDSAFVSAEFQKALLCQSLQPVKVLLKGCTVPWGISPLCVISELAEEESAPSSKQLVKEPNDTEPRMGPWWAPPVRGHQLYLLYAKDPE